MNGMSKIQSSHLQRKAVVYIRQSSIQQVENNVESGKRQYQLKEQAIGLGWKENECIFIDDDLGLTAEVSENREGYQRLISMVALQEVGIIFGIEVSRLARNCLDWYKLLEIASCFGCLIGDEDGIYDPTNFNDRLLLGLKGTISEAELYQIKVRMIRGRMNKAKRGDLEIPLPIGFERDLEGKVIMSADESVRSAIFDVFKLFRQIRSIRGVAVYLRRKAQQLPYQVYTPGLGRKIEWRLPGYDAIYLIITNPTYAGVYSYGKRKKHRDPMSRKVTSSTVPVEQWEVCIPGHHEGYITYEEYQVNRQILKDNNYKIASSKGAPREGEALLQGIVYCKKCGRKMGVQYRLRKSYYQCNYGCRRFGDPLCNWASARKVDAAFEELFLSVLNSGSVDLSIKFALKQKEETARLKSHGEQKLQRLQYEANLARRRYESVDPENRLVASTLEREWNEKLEVLKDAQADFRRQFESEKRLELSIGEIKQLVNDLPEKWLSSCIDMQDKKEIVRTLVENVFLDKQEKIIKIMINWYGGTTTHISIPKNIFTSGHIYHRIKKLARQKTNKQIAEQLNSEGQKTAKGHDWTTRKVMDFRLCHGIASSFTISRRMKIPDSGYVTSGELAKNLRVDQTTIQKWFNAGILDGHQDDERCQLWIKADAETIKRLNGTVPIDPGCVSVRRLVTERKQQMSEIVAWAKNEGKEILRVRRGSRFFFYIRSAKSEGSKALSK